ncbi:hypothetical protein B0H17DRAFT_1123770 [Mycena rosella]|uniref:Uncharacterized protein n=1 Tax=Mycena rosella TaxID=1033263 RepID=A0AAD7H2C6_MYCRO|nr:hypothetical protein B0H17DRAFT_1123770 [Mycena rosella]
MDTRNKVREPKSQVLLQPPGSSKRIVCLGSVGIKPERLLTRYPPGSSKRAAWRPKIAKKIPPAGADGRPRHQKTHGSTRRTWCWEPPGQLGMGAPTHREPPYAWDPFGVVISGGGIHPNMGQGQIVQFYHRTTILAASAGQVPRGSIVLLAPSS